MSISTEKVTAISKVSLTAESLEGHRTIFYDFSLKPGKQGTKGFIATDYEERYAWTADLNGTIEASELTSAVKKRLISQSGMDDAKTPTQRFCRFVGVGEWSDRDANESEEEYRMRQIRLGIDEYLYSLGDKGSDVTVLAAEIPDEPSERTTVPAKSASGDKRHSSGDK